MPHVTRWLALALLASLAWSPASAQAQDGELLVLVVDPGPTQVNQPRLIRAIERATHRRVIRMTDERAPMTDHRLSIAFARPNRWVVRYESGGQVAWVSDRITRPGELRDRLARLSESVVGVIDGPPSASTPEPAAAPPRQRRRSNWDDVIYALQDEIVDPFADEPPDRRRSAVLWSEVIDPFADGRGTGREVWSEVLDPWSTEVRRRR